MTTRYFVDAAGDSDSSRFQQAFVQSFNFLKDETRDAVILVPTLQQIELFCSGIGSLLKCKLDKKNKKLILNDVAFIEYYSLQTIKKVHVGKYGVLYCYYLYDEDLEMIDDIVRHTDNLVIYVYSPRKMVTNWIRRWTPRENVYDLDENYPIISIKDKETLQSLDDIAMQCFADTKNIIDPRDKPKAKKIISDMKSREILPDPNDAKDYLIVKHKASSKFANEVRDMILKAMRR